MSTEQRSYVLLLWLGDAFNRYFFIFIDAEAAQQCGWFESLAPEKNLNL